MKTKELLKKYYEKYDLINNYYQALNIIHFDNSTVGPEKGEAERNEVMSVLGLEAFKLSQDKEYTDLICELYNRRDELSIYDKQGITIAYRNYCNSKNITPELSYEVSMAANNSYMAWHKGKNQNSYDEYREKLRKVVELTIKCVNLRDIKKETIYDTLLDDYEPGSSIKEMDKFFNELKARIVPLVKEIQEHGKPIRNDFLSRKVSIPKQEKFSKYLMKLIGMDMKATLLSTTEHPFTNQLTHHDVRITTHYYEDMFLSNLFSVVHEGGHAIYMQNEPDVLYKHRMAGNQTSAMHETISRFYENMIARSEEFVHIIYPKVQKIAKKQFADVTEKEFYEAVNISEPSLIRTEADELTYCLHIIIRYELERDLVNGVITVDNLPEAWNKKYQEYLGVTPTGYADGLMQDVHWSDGSFGYFPSYALGNAYAAQIYNVMDKEINVAECIKNGKITLIRDWLKKNSFPYGSLMDPSDWIIKVTGEPLNTKYYLDYLENKFRKLYNI